MDGSRNDIGLWGGPYGEEYEYPTDVPETEPLLPTEFALKSPYPNPFNNQLTIPFELPVKADVQIAVFNILGQRVETLILPGHPAGRHVYTWDGSGLASGIYFQEMRAGQFHQLKKIALVK